MHLLKSSTRVGIRLVRVGFLLLLLWSVIGNTAIADDFGAMSANPADRPPVINPDVATRSDDPSQPPAYGPKEAKVLVVVFNDFQCPSCRRASQAIHQISAEFPGDVRLEVWNHASDMHRYAEPAAAAALAAQRQGHFWEMFDLLFQNPGSLDPASLEKHAQTLGLDMDQFREDISDSAIKLRISEETELAGALGGQSTPAFLINGKLFRGWASWYGFRSWVQKELTAASALGDQGMDPFEIQNQRAIDNLYDSEQYELYRTAVLLPNDTRTDK